MKAVEPQRNTGGRFVMTADPAILKRIRGCPFARGGRVLVRFRTNGYSNRVAWVGGVHALSPTRVASYAMRTYSGRPKSNMRFRTLVAMATSVACRPSV